MLNQGDLLLAIRRELSDAGAVVTKRCPWDQ